MNAEAEGKAAAARFRRDHRLGLQPLGDLVAVIEQATRIDVAVLDAGPDEHGLTMRDPKRGTVFIGRRAPQRLLARTIKGYAEGVVSAQAIATLRGIPREAAETELREAGVIPAETPVTWADPDDLPEAHVDWAALDKDLEMPLEDPDVAPEEEIR